MHWCWRVVKPFGALGFWLCVCLCVCFLKISCCLYVIVWSYSQEFSIILAQHILWTATGLNTTLCIMHPNVTTSSNSFISICIIYSLWMQGANKHGVPGRPRPRPKWFSAAFSLSSLKLNPRSRPATRSPSGCETENDFHRPKEISWFCVSDGHNAQTLVSPCHDARPP